MQNTKRKFSTEIECILHYLDINWDFELEIVKNDINLLTTIDKHMPNKFKQNQMK